MEWNKACWINLSEEQIVSQNIKLNEDNNHFVYFRNSFEIKEEAELKILITACSRYKLWVNGKFVIAGPCKSDGYHFYYDEAHAMHGAHCAV